MVRPPRPADEGASKNVFKVALFKMILIIFQVSLEHDDWDAKLACAEFAINNSWQETVKNTPFFLNYGQHPLTPATKQLPSTVPKAADFAEGIVKSVKEARKCMEAAQQKMKARADKHRREVVYSP
jgi:glycosylphosphatidylinositol phospholipase D